MTRKRRIVLLASVLLSLSGLLFASSELFFVHCSTTFTPDNPANVKVLFPGTSYSTVKYQLTVAAGCDCNAVIRCENKSAIPPNREPHTDSTVKPGDSQTIGCPGTEANPVTKVSVWCMGSSGACAGSTESTK
jgi:hypothetical protein